MLGKAAMDSSHCHRLPQLEQDVVKYKKRAIKALFHAVLCLIIIARQAVSGWSLLHCGRGRGHGGRGGLQLQQLQ